MSLETDSSEDVVRSEYLNTPLALNNDDRQRSPRHPPDLVDADDHICCVDFTGW